MTVQYTPLRAIERQRALSQALRQTPRNPANALSGVAHMINMYGAGKAEFLANQKERTNQQLKGQDLNALISVLRSPARDVQGMGGEPIGNIPGKQANFQTPEVQGMYAQSLIAQALAQNKASMPGSRPSNLSEWDEFSRMTPEQQEQYLNMKRAGKDLDLGSKVVLPSQVNPSGPPLASYDKELPPDKTLEYIDASTITKRRAEAAADREDRQPQRDAALDQKTAQMDMLSALIGEAKDAAGLWTTGFIGGNLQGVYGTPAYDLSQKLAAVKANIGFDKLQEMRDNSPTGGALGQVSEKENQLLQAVWGSVEQAQSQEQFVQALDRLDQQIKDSWQRVMEAHEKDYGKPMAISPDQSREPEISDDDLINQYLGAP